ncbi:MAG TPA: MBL fold metallo-hydrolase [Acidimicrobiia bacterium]|nr:MBL fold metallo-hydrolase [Acidimicrobiia bacterium]
MKLSIIGSSGTYPVRGRPTSSYLVEQGSTRIWCDAGPGTFMMLPVAADLLDAIVISHQHPDHCLDVLTAFHAFRYRPQPRSGVPVYCPQSVIDKLRGFVDDYQNGHLETTCHFRPVGDGDAVTIGEIVVRFRATDHSVPTVASRWEANGRVLAYSADTGPEGEWMEVARDADLFLCEASYQGAAGVEPYPHHLTATEAGEIARTMGARNLMLTHIPPHLDPTRSVKEAELAFDRPVALAVPGTSHKV